MKKFLIITLILIIILILTNVIVFPFKIGILGQKQFKGAYISKDPWGSKYEILNEINCIFTRNDRLVYGDINMTIYFETEEQVRIFRQLYAQKKLDQIGNVKITYNENDKTVVIKTKNPTLVKKASKGFSKEELKEVGYESTKSMFMNAGSEFLELKKKITDDEITKLRENYRKLQLENTKNFN